MDKKFFIHDNWKFSNGNNAGVGGINKNVGGEWFKASVPGTIHTDLLKNKLIPDPFYADNESHLQWIGETDWQYKSSFDVPKGLNISEPVELIFEGLDTTADIFLNDEQIGSVDNMFIKYSYNVTGLLKKKNELRIDFKSPVKFARKLEEKHGKLPVALRSERVYIRKAQYSFGWDWGPTFVTSGIWKPVYLRRIQENGIKSFTFETKSITEKEAKVNVKVRLKKPMKKGERINVKIFKGKQSYAAEFALTGKSEASIRLNISSPELWWPNGSGKQSLYNLQIKLDKDNKTIDEIKKKVGIRTINLQQKEGNKNTFRFIVNGKPVFAKGANWIPADPFLPNADYIKYKTLLTLAKNADMNFIRDWGGGIYEHDYFYELCDELGLMVWQDFMFACASYPEHKDFIENVREEVVQNVERLQHHPCIAIWCGNNENEWIWFRENEGSYKNMPGYNIYHELIPEVLNNVDPQRPYWPSSPFGSDADPNSENSGNRHQWDIWSFWVDYKKVSEDKSLFVTEFGFQSSAETETINEVLPHDQRHAQSAMFEYHNKQVEGPERLFKFLSGHLPVKTGLKDFVYLTQLNQGLALKECVEHWQYRYPDTNGSIIWQLNDCWPVASWAMVDSALRPKLSYYLVKESFSPLLIKFVRENGHLEIGFKNNGGSQFRGYLEILYIVLPGGKSERIVKKKIIEPAGSSSHSVSITVPEELDKSNALIVASVYDNKNNLKKRSAYCATEWKYLKLPKAKIKIKGAGSKSKNIVRISSDKPAFFVKLHNSNFVFENNGFILLPGEEVETGYTPMSKFKAKSAANISVSCLNDYLHR